MGTTILDKNGIAIVKFTGHLNALTAPEAERAIDEVVASGKQCLVFDLADLEYVSSTGLRVILSAVKEVMKMGGQVALASMNERVREIFDVSGLTSLFLITDSVEEALEKASSRG